jgi:hypothetical protein
MEPYLLFLLAVVKRKKYGSKSPTAPLLFVIFYAFIKTHDVTVVESVWLAAYFFMKLQPCFPH